MPMHYWVALEKSQIKCYTAIPHKTLNGTVLNATYGDRPAIQRIVGLGNGGLELELSDETVNEILGKKLARSKYVENGDTITVRFGHPDYPVSYHPKYKAGYGPIDVKIIDPLKVVSTDYELTFNDFIESYTHNITGNLEIQGDSALRMASHWELDDLNDTLPPFKGDTTTVYGDEKMFIDKGIAITLKQPYEFGCIKVGTMYYDSEWHDWEAVVAENNGVVGSSIEFDDPDHVWLDGIRDTDNAGAASVLNWIRSGTYASTGTNAVSTDNDYSMSSSANNAGGSKPWDPDENFENIARGTWAPYLLCTYSGQGAATNPGPVYNGNSRVGKYFRRTNSVDIVLTADKSKWTRCPVIEMCMDEKLSEGGVKRFALRKHASIDKDGNPYMIKDENNQDIQFNLWSLADNSEYVSQNEEDANFIAPQGMGWFPGYVIDVESGTRLNVAYGEDSYLEDLNGRDMLFNPAKLQKTTVEADDGLYELADPAVVRGADGLPVFGGKHFVYIFRNDSIELTGNSPYKDFISPAYDGGAANFKTLNYIQQHANQANIFNIEFYKLGQWMGMPMGVAGEEWLP